MMLQRQPRDAALHGRNFWRSGIRGSRPVPGPDRADGQNPDRMSCIEATRARQSFSTHLTEFIDAGGIVQ